MSLLAVGRYRWRHNMSTAVYILKLSRAVTEYNVELRQLSDVNHLNDRCTEYTEPEMCVGRYRIFLPLYYNATASWQMLISRSYWSHGYIFMIYATLSRCHSHIAIFHSGPSSINRCVHVKKGASINLASVQTKGPAHCWPINRSIRSIPHVRDFHIYKHISCVPTTSSDTHVVTMPFKK